VWEPDARGAGEHDDGEGLLTVIQTLQLARGGSRLEFKVGRRWHTVAGPRDKLLVLAPGLPHRINKTPADASRERITFVVVFHTLPGA